MSENEISELPEDSNDVFRRNMLDRYIDRPNTSFVGGKFSVLNEFCYAEFLRYYYLVSKAWDENDYQPEVLKDEMFEYNLTDVNSYPKIMPLMSSEDKPKCWKVPFVLQFYVPNKERFLEEHAHHLLFLSFPFRNEAEI